MGEEEEEGDEEYSAGEEEEEDTGEESERDSDNEGGSDGLGLEREPRPAGLRLLDRPSFKMALLHPKPR